KVFVESPLRRAKPHAGKTKRGRTGRPPLTRPPAQGLNQLGGYEEAQGAARHDGGGLRQPQRRQPPACKPHGCSPPCLDENFSWRDYICNGWSSAFRLFLC